MTKPRTRIVHKSKDGVTLDFKGDIGQVTTSWDEFNQIYNIEDKIWAVFNDAAWEKVQERQKKVNEAIKKIKNNEPDFTLDNAADEIMSALSCSKDRALKILRDKLGKFDEKKFQKVKKKEKKVVPGKTMRIKKIKSSAFTMGDVPGFEKLKEMKDEKDDKGEEKK